MQHDLAIHRDFYQHDCFCLLDPGKSPELAHDADPSEHHSTDGPNAIAVCLCIGSFCTIGAAFATRLRNLYRGG
jgi:solute carrier family 45 protein 1/2/4